MKILVVDDDALQRMLLVELLKRFEKVDVVEAESGDAAWELLQGGLCPVLCCCDMRMPGMSGMELLRLFKSRAVLAEVPFVFITASTDCNTIEDAIASGAANYIPKPFNLTKSRSSLEKIFRRIRERYCEEPAVTIQRLSVAPERLLSHFAALKQQLADARAPVCEHLSNGDVANARFRLDRLQTGCKSVGLWHAAMMIEHLLLEPNPVDYVLAEVDIIIDAQIARTRAEFGIRAVAKPKPEVAAVDEDMPLANAA
jgi:two-component system chemotaxis response regulator CheY